MYLGEVSARIYRSCTLMRCWCRLNKIIEISGEMEAAYKERLRDVRMLIQRFSQKIARCYNRTFRYSFKKGADSQLRRGECRSSDRVCREVHVSFFQNIAAQMRFLRHNPRGNNSREEGYSYLLYIVNVSNAVRCFFRICIKPPPVSLIKLQEGIDIA